MSTFDDGPTSPVFEVHAHATQDPNENVASYDKKRRTGSKYSCVPWFRYYNRKAQPSMPVVSSRTPAAITLVPRSPFIRSTCILQHEASNISFFLARLFAEGFSYREDVRFPKFARISVTMDVCYREEGLAKVLPLQICTSALGLSGTIPNDTIFRPTDQIPTRRASSNPSRTSWCCSDACNSFVGCFRCDEFAHRDGWLLWYSSLPPGERRE